MQLLRAVSHTGILCMKHLLQKAQGAQGKASHPSEHTQLLIALSFPVFSSLLALSFVLLNAPGFTTTCAYPQKSSLELNEHRNYAMTLLDHSIQ